MKLIIAGGRDFNNPEWLFDVMDWYYENSYITEIVSGKQRTKDPFGQQDWGADYIGELYATYRNIAIKPFPAEWDKYGRSAGHRRNMLMAKYADALVAFHDGKSKGTKNMIRTMEQMEKPNVVYSYGN